MNSNLPASREFVCDTSAVADTPQAHGAVTFGCACGAHDAPNARRRAVGWLMAGALGAVAPGAFAQRESNASRGGQQVDGNAQRQAPMADLRAECKRSTFAGVVDAQQIEAQAAQQYQQMLQQAAQQRALAPDNNAQLIRLRYIAQRIIPFADACNPRARQWRWDVNLIGSKQLNAFCMPGGKIAFFYGILSQLQLNDDEVAAIMGHEVAHALLEHAREQTGKGAATEIGLRGLAAILGLGGIGDMAAQVSSQLLSLKYGRNDESEADSLGVLLAAQAGYDPRAGVSLWRKMGSLSRSEPPQWLSTHPSGADRIRRLESLVPGAMPYFERAPKPTQRFQPPAQQASQER